MNKLLFLCIAFCPVKILNAQTSVRTLSFYIEAAHKNSPLIKDYQNQKEIQKSELQRVKSAYTRSRIEIDGNVLFVPIISRKDGTTSFEWNAQDGTDYYGYDLGESSGHFHAGITWTQPLLGRSSFNEARRVSQIQEDILMNNIRLEAHQLERIVTEQYILCLLDKIQLNYADSTQMLLDCQYTSVEKMAQDGLCKISDLHLISIEQDNNCEQIVFYKQSYHAHLMELNNLCGIVDTTDVDLEDINMTISRLQETKTSSFMNQYRLDSLNAIANLKSFNLQYRPKLDLFVNGGMQTSDYSHLEKRIGWSAGLTFSWLIYDGKQRRQKERQMELELSTISAYKDEFQKQNYLCKQRCISEMRNYEERENLLRNRIAHYNQVLLIYNSELQNGQLSVLEYITVLRNKIQTEKEFLILLSNKQLLIASFNYWNW